MSKKKSYEQQLRDWQYEEDLLKIPNILAGKHRWELWDDNQDEHECNSDCTSGSDVPDYEKYFGPFPDSDNEPSTSKKLEEQHAKNEPPKPILPAETTSVADKRPSPAKRILRSSKRTVNHVAEREKIGGKKKCKKLFSTDKQVIFNFS